MFCAAFNQIGRITKGSQRREKKDSCSAVRDTDKIANTVTSFEFSKLKGIHFHKIAAFLHQDTLCTFPWRCMGDAWLSSCMAEGSDAYDVVVDAFTCTVRSSQQRNPDRNNTQFSTVP